MLLHGLFVGVICVVFVRACLSVCSVRNVLCDVAWCFACCLLRVCVSRFDHVKSMFVSLGGFIV